MTTTPALDDLPLRAQCGYVCKYGRVAEGDLTPSVIAGILAARGVLDEDVDLEGVKQVAGEVLAHWDGGGEA